MTTNRIVAMGSRLVLATALTAFASFILACGSSYPSESAARTALENLGKMGGSWYKVKAFTKTNGKGDDKKYTVEYDAELECGPTPRNTTIILPPGVPHAEECLKSGGRMIKVSGTMAFENTEKGWRGPDGKVY